MMVGGAGGGLISMSKFCQVCGVRVGGATLGVRTGGVPVLICALAAESNGAIRMLLCKGSRDSGKCGWPPEELGLIPEWLPTG